MNILTTSIAISTIIINEKLSLSSKYEQKALRCVTLLSICFLIISSSYMIISSSYIMTHMTATTQSSNSYITFFHRYSVIPTLADILSESVKEKVTRIVLAVFRNLIEKPEDPAIARENCIQMVQCKVCVWDVWCI